jgi:1-acyl-sn-glycerol-3-phosphate acyltransferase
MSEEVKKDEHKLLMLERIKEYEKQGKFDIDSDDNLPTIELQPNQIDYERKKLKNKILRQIVYAKAKKMLNQMKKNGVFRLKEIKGVENLSDLKTGAVITCNHFDVADSFLVEMLFRETGKNYKNMYRVIREGNFTNPPHGFEPLMRNCNTLPLSQNKDTMKLFLKAVNNLLQKGKYVLIYPEESMWWNYRKPRPLKNGAFRFAVKNGVPVVPVFITMEDSNDVGADGFFIQIYTINIGKPIYADENLSLKENIEKMKDENFEFWKNTYEQFYNIPLEYETEISDDMEDVVKKYAKKK